MQKQFTFLLLILIILNVACSSDEVNLATEDVFAIRAIDIGNKEDASDLLVTFKVRNFLNIQELRAFLINPDDFPNFTSSKLEKLASNTYQVISEVQADNQINLSSSLKDVDGNDLIVDQPYFLGFGVVIGDDVLLNTQIGEAALSKDHFLTGKFGGTWDDNIYSGFGISADLTFNENSNQLSGPFWYSNNFLSCCGGTNDGRISMVIENNQINNFRYDQKLVSFMGGACDGTYTGGGQVENLGELVINFEGDDCEGPHTGGRIRLTRTQ